MKLLLTLVAVCACSTAASAAPKMLNCTIPTTGGITTMAVMLNEENGTVSYSFPDNGRSYTMRAIFAPDRVAFNRFSISRIDLSIQRINDGQFDQSVFKQAPVDYGKCLVDNRQRAI